jgi:hypothetical protein
MLRRSTSNAILFVLAHAAALATVGCGDDSFHVQRAPEFPKVAGATVSVFGVFRDGRLAPEAWDSFRSHLSPLFGTSSCEPGYPDILTSSGTPTLQAVDDFTRANGVTDELLDRLAPLARGDLILLITMTGRPPTKADSEKESATPTPTTSPGMRGPGRGRGTPSSPTRRSGDVNAFEVVGVVFSMAAHHSVGAIRMTYTGTSMEDALQSFMTRLGAELPQAVCGAWKMDGHVDVADIKRLETE